MITIQNADAALKDYYLDAFAAQLNENVSPFFSAIEKNSECVSGKDVKLSVIKGFAGNVIAGDEDGDLPRPYANRYATITMPLKNIYGTIEISDKALRASRESAGAFVNLINAEMEGLVKNAQQNMRRMLFGDGTAYLVGLGEKISERQYKLNFAKHYFVGMRVDVCDAMDHIVTGSEGVIVESVDTDKKTVTFSEDIPGSAEDGWLHIHGAENCELSGLKTIFGKEKVYGFNKKEDSYFAPYVTEARELSEQLLSEVLDKMEEDHNSKINMIICSYKTRREIASLADANRRVVNTIDTHAGYGTVSVNNVPVIADSFCSDEEIYLLNTDDFALYQLCDWEWLEDEDGKILKQIPGKAAYSATLVKYAELICRKPCGQAKINFYR